MRIYFVQAEPWHAIWIEKRGQHGRSCYQVGLWVRRRLWPGADQIGDAEDFMAYLPNQVLPACHHARAVLGKVDIEIGCKTYVIYLPKAIVEHVPEAKHYGSLHQ